jgi:hypothetical protein
VASPCRRRSDVPWSERHENGPASITAWLPSVPRVDGRVALGLLRLLLKEVHRLADGFGLHLSLYPLFFV